MTKLSVLALLFVSVFLTACKGKTTPIPDDQFVGIWEIKGADLTDGMQIQIKKENNRLVGRVLKLNDNKYVRLFVDSNDVWITEINRRSNFEFKLSENKVGKALFSVYGQKTAQEFQVQFIDGRTFGLAPDGSDPLKSSRVYMRVH